MAHPRVEDIRDPVVATPERAHRGEDVAFVGRSGATDHEIHRVILP
jgi:hypothetical protein